MLSAVVHHLGIHAESVHPGGNVGRKNPAFVEHKFDLFIKLRYLDGHSFVWRHNFVNRNSATMKESTQSIEVHSSHMFLYSQNKHRQVIQRCSQIAAEKGSALTPADLHSEDMMNYFGTSMLEKFLDRYGFLPTFSLY
jgi:hypothetical protein